MTLFDQQPRLSDDTLLLRPLAEADFEGLYLAASAPATWAGHPKHDRWQRDVFEDYFASLLDSGGCLVAIDSKPVDEPDPRIIGCSRYYSAPDQLNSVAIGFTFLDHHYWGGVWNKKMKALMLEHAFAVVDEVWLHIAPSNLRSQRAAEKIGAQFQYKALLAIAGEPAETLCYSISQSQWQANGAL